MRLCILSACVCTAHIPLGGGRTGPLPWADGWGGGCWEPAALDLYIHESARARPANTSIRQFHGGPGETWTPRRRLHTTRRQIAAGAPGPKTDLPKASYRARGLRLCLIIILRSSSALRALRRRPAFTICWIHGDSSQRRAWPGSRTSGLCGRQNGTRCDGSPEDQLAKDMCSLIWGSMSAAGRR